MTNCCSVTAFVATRTGTSRLRKHEEPPSRFFSDFSERHQNHAALYSLPKVVEKNAVKVAATGGVAIGTGPTVVIGLAALLIGLVLGRLTKSGAGQRLSNVDEMSNVDETETGAAMCVNEKEEMEEGVTPLWLNYAFARMWALFQKNTKRVVTDVIQPVLDDTEKPDFVTDVRISSFVPGRQSPYLRSLRRLPSRALAEVQYKLQMLFSSTSEMVFDVDVSFKDKVNFTIPVTMKNLDLDATLWTSFNLVPYDPFCTSVQYALLKEPLVSFDMNIAGFIPITAVPVLRSFFFRVVTKEIPKEFLYPNTVTLDFTPETITDHRGERKAISVQNLSKLSHERLVELYPEQWALYDALDLDGGGSISAVELFAGLKDWGYTASDATASFDKLDINKDGMVHFDEFCQMWPTLAASFVPNRYKGVLAVFLRKGENIKKPLIGPDDPVVEIRLGEQHAVSKRDSRTSVDGRPGFPVWNEPFELNCVSPKTESLEIIVSDSSPLTFRGLRKSKEVGKGTVPLESLLKQPTQRVKVELEPQGSVEVDLSYAEFVDQQSFFMSKDGVV